MNSLCKWEKKGGQMLRKQMPHTSVLYTFNTPSNRFTFSGHFTSFGNRKGFGTEIMKYLEVPIPRESFSMENKVLKIMVVRENY